MYQVQFEDDDIDQQLDGEENINSSIFGPATVDCFNFHLVDFWAKPLIISLLVFIGIKNPLELISNVFLSKGPK